jgi:hypothetical protein
MQTMHRPLVPLPILTNHTPPISSPYWLPTLHVNVGSKPYTFPHRFDHAHVHFFPPSILPTPLIAHDQTPQPTLFSTRLQPPPKIYFPICWCQFTSWRLIHHQRSHQPPNSFNTNLRDHPNSIPSFIPTPPALTWTWGFIFGCLSVFSFRLFSSSIV